VPSELALPIPVETPLPEAVCIPPLAYFIAHSSGSNSRCSGRASAAQLSTDSKRWTGPDGISSLQHLIYVNPRRLATRSLYSKVRYQDREGKTERCLFDTSGASRRW
jgi:hypothetical protein